MVVTKKGNFCEDMYNCNRYVMKTWHGCGHKRVFSVRVKVTALHICGLAQDVVVWLKAYVLC